MKMVNVKEVFVEGLIRLAQKKDISKITVQNIVDECKSSRRTFYNYFSDKYDLMNWVYEFKTQEILECFRSSKSWLDCVIDMYMVVEQDQAFYKNISAFSGQNSFVDFLFEYCREVFMNSIVESHGKEVLTDELIYAIEHHCYGITYTAIKWIQEGLKIPAATIATWQYKSMPELLKKHME